MISKPEHSMPWYREPLVWLLIAIPGSAVVMGAVLLTLASSSYDGLVADDYYKRGLQINRSIGRDKYAARLGITADVRIEHGSLALTLAGRLEESPDTLTLRFLHATRQGRDQVVLLKHVGNREYRAALGEQEIESNTLVRLESKVWRIGQRLHAAPGNQARFSLEAQPG